jgi:hypothetical protein
MSGAIEAPPELDPQLPPPDSARVALLQGLSWPEGPAEPPPTFEEYASLPTIHGRPLNDQEKALLKACTYNDMAASLQLNYEAVQIVNERHALSQQMGALLRRYGFFGPGAPSTIGQARATMTPQDAAELDRLADVLFPDGYMWLK